MLIIHNELARLATLSLLIVAIVPTLTPSPSSQIRGSAEDVLDIILIEHLPRTVHVAWRAKTNPATSAASAASAVISGDRAAPTAIATTKRKGERWILNDADLLIAR